jgi:hypothetical protein
LDSAGQAAVFDGCGNSMGKAVYQPRPNPCNRVQRRVESESCVQVGRSEYVKKMCSPNQALKLTELALVNRNANTQT